jgi:hypothetical protein
VVSACIFSTSGVETRGSLKPSNSEILSQENKKRKKNEREEQQTHKPNMNAF